MNTQYWEEELETMSREKLQELQAEQSYRIMNLRRFHRIWRQNFLIKRYQIKYWN